MRRGYHLGKHFDLTLDQEQGESIEKSSQYWLTHQCYKGVMDVMVMVMVVIVLTVIGMVS